MQSSKVNVPGRPVNFVSIIAVQCRHLGRCSLVWWAPC